MVDARGAVIHLVIRNHGVPIPDRLSVQMSSFNGGCDVNICSNDQFAVHE